MKKDIHLELHPVIYRDSGAGKDFFGTSINTSDKKETHDGVEYYVINVDLSSASHPFYTGQENIIDTSGKVDKFRKRASKKSETGKKVKDKKNSKISVEEHDKMVDEKQENVSK